LDYQHYITNLMSLDNRDLEEIELFVYKSGDDIAVSVARSFERIEERMDEAESRLHSRLKELEEKLDDMIDLGNGPNNHD